MLQVAFSTAIFNEIYWISNKISLKYGPWTPIDKSWVLLTHLPLVPHMNWVIIGSGNGLSPVWHQANTWNSAGILLIGPFGTNFSEISIKFHAFSFKKMHLKMLSEKWRPFYLGVNVLMA